MDHLILRHEFETRQPWITKFFINGQAYGGNFDALNDARVEQFFSAFPNARTILELGSLEGGHTFALARRSTVKHVLGIEGRAANVAKAKFVQKLLGIQNANFVEANLEDTDLTSFGTFDAVFCCGLLYHLPRPWELIDQVSRVSTNLFLSTHYAKEDRATTVHHGVKGMIYQEIGLADPLSGLSAHSFWPTFNGLTEMLMRYGFTTIHIVHDNREHPHGPITTLSAAKQ